MEFEEVALLVNEIVRVATAPSAVGRNCTVNVWLTPGASAPNVGPVTLNPPPAGVIVEAEMFTSKFPVLVTVARRELAGPLRATLPKSIAAGVTERLRTCALLVPPCKEMDVIGMAASLVKVIDSGGGEGPAMVGE